MDEKKELTIAVYPSRNIPSARGWTYFMLSKDRKRVKIGKSIYVNCRPAELSKHNDYYKGLGVWFALNDASLETELHKFYGRYRKSYRPKFDGKHINITRYEAQRLCNKKGKLLSQLYTKTALELFEFPLPISKKIIVFLNPLIRILSERYNITVEKCRPRYVSAKNISKL